MLLGFGLIARLFGLRVWRLIRYFKDELLIAFSATSGEAMIPRAVVKLENMGCSKEVVGLVLPTGFSFNMDGTAIYMTMAVLFIAQACDIPLSLGQQFTILFVMLFTSKGAAGVTGGGFVALAATMPALGILPIGGLTLAPWVRALHGRDPRGHQPLQQHLRDGCRRQMDGRTRRGRGRRGAERSGPGRIARARRAERGAGLGARAATSGKSGGAGTPPPCFPCGGRQLRHLTD